MDVDNLRAQLKGRLRELGISAREASRRAGFNVGYVGDILDGRSKTPDAERVLKLAESLDMDAAQLLGDSPLPARDSRSSREALPFGDERRIGGRMLPLMGAPLPMSRQFIPFLEEPIGTVPAPFMLLDVPDAFAAMVPNNVHAPRFNAGEMVYVNPAATPAPGESVWLRKKDNTVAIARLAAIGAESVSLLFFGLEGDERAAEVPYEDIKALKKIVAAAF